jgi:transposase
MSAYYVGLDVHSRESVFVVQDTTGTVVGEGRVVTSPDGFTQLAAAHALSAGTPVALESGPLAFFVARTLEAVGLAPVVIDAYEVRRLARRPPQKSDRRDAFELADGLRRDLYRTRVHVPRAAIVALRETLSRRRHFVRLQTAEINAAKRLLRAAGLAALARRSLRTATGWRRVLAALPAEAIALATHVTQPHAVWAGAGAQIAALEAALATAPAADAATLARLQTVPGVGPIVALTTVAVLADVARFPSAKHVASYAGLVPRTYQSGTRDRHGALTKRGARELRAMLCEAAHHARPPLAPVARHLPPLDRPPRVSARDDRARASAQPRALRDATRPAPLRSDRRPRRPAGRRVTPAPSSPCAHRVDSRPRSQVSQWAVEPIKLIGTGRAALQRGATTPNG